MTADTQYRALGNGANLRTDPSVNAKIITTLSPDTIIHVDTNRTPDTDSTGHRWLPVTVINGWVREDVVGPIEQPS